MRTRYLIALTVTLLLSACARLTPPGSASPQPQALAGEQLVAWGPNAFAQTEVPALPEGVRYTAAAASFVHSLALRSDGQLDAWGLYGETEIPALPGGVRYIAVSAGGQGNSLALRSDGRVAVWGPYAQAAVPALPTGLRYTAVAAGNNHSLALRSDGRLVAWGDTSRGQTSVPALPEGLRYTAAAGGLEHSLALRSDGQIVAWGNADEGQLAVPPLPAGLRYTRVAAGAAHNLALRSDGRVVAWGRGDKGQTAVPTLPAGLRYSAVAAGLEHSLALRSDGRILAWGDNSSDQLEVPPLPSGARFTSVVTGGFHNLALVEASPTYTVDLTRAPAGQTLWELWVGRGITYRGTGIPEGDPVRVLGQRRSNGELVPGNAVRAVSGKLTVVLPGTNTPNPGGGLIDLKFAPRFGDAGTGGKVVPLRLSVSGVTRGAYVALIADGRVVERIDLLPERGVTQTLALGQTHAGILRVYVPGVFTLDDVVFRK